MSSFEESGSQYKALIAHPLTGTVRRARKPTDPTDYGHPDYIEPYHISHRSQDQGTVSSQGQDGIGVSDAVRGLVDPESTNTPSVLGKHAKRGAAWSDNEHDAIHSILIQRRNEEATEKSTSILRDEALWNFVSNELANNQNIIRSSNGCKFYWARYGRERSGFDERRPKSVKTSSSPLATGVPK